MSETTAIKKPIQNKLLAALRWLVITVTAIIYVLLFVYAVLSTVDGGYGPVLDGTGLYSVSGKSMEPLIPDGALIEVKAHSSGTVYEKGQIITYELNTGQGVLIITHKIVRTDIINGRTVYITKGINADKEDSYYVESSQIKGLYTGKNVVFLGAFFSVFRGVNGILLLIIVALITAVLIILRGEYSKYNARSLLERRAMQKGIDVLNNVQLRFDNIREVSAVTELISLISKKATGKKSRKETEDRLNEFINAQILVFSSDSETAAVLANLPPPTDTPSLIAALQSGSTLRQSNDGSRLLLTSPAGVNNMLLIPTQTPQGVLLSPSGEEVKVDIAPNIEDVNPAPLLLDVKRLNALNELLEKDITPLSPAESLALEEYRNARKKPQKPKPPKPVLTEEQEREKRLKRQAAAAQRAEQKRIQTAYVNSLSDRDREIYILTQQRQKAEQQAINRLKRIERDRKAYERIKKQSKNS